MTRGAAAVALAAGCWTGDPPPEPPHAAPHRHASDAGVREARIDALEHQLRTGGVPWHAGDALVVLDLAADSITIACDAVAVQATRNWGALAADPGRPAPTCMPMQYRAPLLVCHQDASIDPIVLVFEDARAPRLLGAIVHANSTAGTSSGTLTRFADELGGPRCLP